MKTETGSYAAGERINLELARECIKISYDPKLDPPCILSQIEPLTDATDAYKSFEERRP